MFLFINILSSISFSPPFYPSCIEKFNNILNINLLNVADYFKKQM